MLIPLSPPSALILTLSWCFFHTYFLLSSLPTPFSFHFIHIFSSSSPRSLSALFQLLLITFDPCRAIYISLIICIRPPTLCALRSFSSPHCFIRVPPYDIYAMYERLVYIDRLLDYSSHAIFSLPHLSSLRLRITSLSLISTRMSLSSLQIEHFIPLHLHTRSFFYFSDYSYIYIAASTLLPYLLFSRYSLTLHNSLSLSSSYLQQSYNLFYPPPQVKYNISGHIGSFYL